MSVPVLSWSLIGDRTAHCPRKGRAAKQRQSTSSLDGTELVPKDLPRPTNGSTRFLHKARSPRPSEPILIPKLRIQFADFPYLHYSIDQRLLTLETCCGYEYDLVRHCRANARFFKGQCGGSRCREKYDTLRKVRHNPFLVTITFQGQCRLNRTDNSAWSTH